jgi:NhaP-type Na+/H+ or K+/H+ antiporter
MSTRTQVLTRIQTLLPEISESDKTVEKYIKRIDEVIVKLAETFVFLYLGDKFDGGECTDGEIVIFVTIIRNIAFSKWIVKEQAEGTTK